MIYKITFDDGRIDWCTAKDQLHLLKSYDADFDLPLQGIESLEEISDALAMTTMVVNTEYDGNDTEDVETISVYDLAVGDDFCIIASTEFD
ncbi:MAG: hypothetical protein WAW57_15340 [Lutibacter sp.]